jgi:DNA processing protein
LSRGAPQGAFSPAERRDRLRLARTETIGPVLFASLISRFGTAAHAIEALPHLARRGGRTTPLSVCTLAEADRELEAGAALGAVLIAAGEPDFPPLLAALDPPPPLIWTLGHPALLSKPAVAVVGARVASAGGQRFARQLALELGEAGYVIVSGLARGVDGAAHEGALKTGTAAVLGGGIDDIYPPEHEALYRLIAAAGCLVSENAVGRRAKAQDFPRRNRIISGLSLGVVVVEAEMRSGSLITARLANEQGREVFAVPGSPLDPRAKGTNDLIRQGAALCEGAEDVIRALQNLPTIRERERDLFDPPDLDQAALDREADRLRGQIEALLSPTPVPRDELVRALHAPPAAVFAALVELALAGKAELLAGGLVARG